MVNYSNYLYALCMTGIDVLVMPVMKAKHLGMLTGSWVFPYSMILYSLQPLIFYKSLTVENMGIMIILWNVTTDIVIALIGFYMFGETLTSVQCGGLVLCLVGVTLLGMK